MTTSAPGGLKPFRVRVIELISGSTLAQIFSALLMPVISRMYSPGEMGDYAIYVSVSGIIGLLAGLRLDWAVMIATDDEEASRLAWMGLFFSLITGSLTFLFISARYGLSIFAIGTSFSVVCTGGVQALVTWCSRHQRYRTLAGRNAGEKFLVLMLGIGFGYFGMSRFGLIASQSFGLLFSLFYLLIAGNLKRPRFTTTPWGQTLRKYRDFPSKNLISTVLLSASLLMPNLLFAVVFQKTALGQFNLVSRVFDIPITLIGYAFSTVYYQHSSVMPHDQRLRLYWKSLRFLTMIFLPFFIILSFTGPFLFTSVFGEQWDLAGSLAQWLAPLTMARLLFVSQSSLLLVQRKLGLDLAISLLLFLAQAGGFVIGYGIFHSLPWCVIFMSLFGTGVYLIALKMIHLSLSSFSRPISIS